MQKNFVDRPFGKTIIGIGAIGGAVGAVGAGTGGLITAIRPKLASSQSNGTQPASNTAQPGK